jgi:hypothetical protein
MARQATQQGLTDVVRGLLSTDAVRDAWRAFWISRAVVWVAGVAAFVLAGLHGRNAEAFDQDGLTRPFGEAGDALVAPAARWDAMWFLTIAEDGYDGQRAAFFPLYPLLVRAAAVAVRSDVVAGILVSLACFGAALVLLHLLVALDFGREVAATCVLLVAVVPGAMWFSAIYSEALFLLLSVGAVYAARTGRWAWAGSAGALAASTRSAGLVLVVPLVLLWWQREKTGSDPVFSAAWIGLVPFGLLAFCGLLALAGEDPWGPLRAQEAWMRSFAGPFMAIPQGAEAAWDGARAIVAGDRRPLAPFDVAWLDVGLFATLVAVLGTLAGAIRRLPPAYWAYALAALALPLSYPVEGQPLMSLPRFAAVLWPLHLWLALWLVRRGTATRRVVVVASLAGLAAVSAEVATWGWVA